MRRGTAKRTRSIAAVIEEAKARHLYSETNTTPPAEEAPSAHVEEPAAAGAAVQLHPPAEQQQAVPSDGTSEEDAGSSSDDDVGADPANILSRGAHPGDSNAGRSLSHQGTEPHEPGLTPGAPAVEAHVGMKASDDDLSSDDEPVNEDAELLARLTAGLFSSLVSSSQQEHQRPLAGRWQQQQPANALDAALLLEQGHNGTAPGDAGIGLCPAAAITASGRWQSLELETRACRAAVLCCTAALWQ